MKKLLLGLALLLMMGLSFADEPVYVMDVPFVVDNVNGWETSFVFTNFTDDQDAHITMTFHNQWGAYVQTVEMTIEPHCSFSFYMSFFAQLYPDLFDFIGNITLTSDVKRVKGLYLNANETGPVPFAYGEVIKFEEEE